jgi:hypothetical protein
LGFCSKGSGAWRQRRNKNVGFCKKNGGLMGSTQEELLLGHQKFRFHQEEVVFGKGKVGFPHGFKNKQKTTQGGFLKMGQWVHPQIIQSLDHDEIDWNSHGDGSKTPAAWPASIFSVVNIPGGLGRVYPSH